MVTPPAPRRPPRAPAALRPGRSWRSPQPNVTGRGILAGYSARFWAIVIVLGAITGLAASALSALLTLVEHLAYGYRRGPFLDGVAAAAGWRHIVALIIAAALLGVGALLLQRLPSGTASEVSEALWRGGARLAFVPSIARGVLSIVTVGLGVSLGREGAPQLAGAATASRLADWAQLPIWQRRLLVASGAGAGFAAVYNVPLGGALFALEVLLGTIALPLVLPALATSVIATATSWITLGTGPTYRLPAYGVRPSQLAWAVLAGPIIGIVAIAWVRIIERASALRPRRWGRVVAPLVVFTVLGVVSLQYPQLLGNGKGVVQLEAVGSLSLGLLCVLLVLKPLATAACLGSGSPGGLFTPTLTVGVLLSGVLGSAWTQLWPGARLGSYAIIGGGAFLAAAMQGPLSGLVLVLELTRNFDALMVPTLVAVIEATVIARKLGAPSIYSARMRPESDPAGRPAFLGTAAGRAAGEAAIDTLDVGRTPDEALPPPDAARTDPPPEDPGPDNDKGRRPPHGDHPHDDRRPENAR